MERCFFFLKRKKKNNRDLLCPAERVWCLLLMLRRLLHWAVVQISLLSRKYGFLTRRHPRLRTFHQSRSQGGGVGAGMDSDSAGPLQGCAALHAALARPTRISHPPAAFTRLSCLHLFTEAACTCIRNGEAEVALWGGEGVVCFARAKLLKATLSLEGLSDMSN